MSARGPVAPLPLRARLAVAAVNAVNRLSRWSGVGSGSVVGGRAGLLVDPGLLERLAAGRRVALVSGTNGKTTTTGLLAAALATPGSGVVTNSTGANMPAGHVAALARDRSAPVAVLEVDEGYVPRLLRSLRPAVLVLLNLSRDQLDRTSEVRMVANRWHEALAAWPTTVVANADDPLVAWGAGSAADVRWVAGGLGWRADAAGCPACQGRIAFETAPGAGWSCECGFARPSPSAWIEEREGAPEVNGAPDRGGGPGGDGVAHGNVAVLDDGRRVTLDPRIPGRFNRANMLMAAVAAEVMGVPAERALAAMAAVDEVAGRFGVRRFDGVAARLMLAKNPAGWSELLGLVCPGSGPVVVGINARVADGRDPSWLWDVPFEQLSGRPVVATGERCRDLSVRLRYAEVPHRVVAEPRRAVQAAADWAGATSVDFIGNYTAFHDLAGRP